MDSSVQDRESSSIGASHHGSSLCLCGDTGRSPSRPQASADAEAVGCIRTAEGWCGPGYDRPGGRQLQGRGQPPLATHA